MQSLWIQDFIERMIYGRNAVDSAIQSFAQRRAAEQEDMAAARDPQRAEQLRLTLSDIDGEIGRLEMARAGYQQRLEQFQALAATPINGAVKLDRTALDQVKLELRRLRRVYRHLGAEFEMSDGVPAQQLHLAEQLTGIELDPHLRAMWRMTDGSNVKRWFAEGDEDDFEYYGTSEFLSLQRAVLDRWTVMSESEDEDESEEERHEAVQPHYLHHHLWFPFADADNGITTLYFEGAIPPLDKKPGETSCEQLKFSSKALYLQGF